MQRRTFLRSSVQAAAGAGLLGKAPTQPAAVRDRSAALAIDPRPLFEISPYLFMQFMEPLGTTDGSVEAAWDYDRDDWRKDLVEATRGLSPDVIRYGGILSRYYKWREGIGPAERRPLMRNYEWGGKETHRVGTHEFVDFCRRIGAEPLYCVNFLGDGRPFYQNTPEGNRTGDAREAADWVSYANDPDSRERKALGIREPYHIKLWQIGNETSYGTDGFTRQQSIEHTIEFARAMRARDPSIQLIGWGDWGRGRDTEFWAGDLADRAGEHLNYVAIHLMGQRPMRKDTVLAGLRYQAEPERAWEELIELAGNVKKKVAALEQVLDGRKSNLGIAVTEGHLSLAPRNANPLLLEWLSSVYHASSMNIYQRHGARVRIATAADFCGTRWTVNAVMIEVPRGISYLTPAGSVMQLFKRHNGKQGVAVRSAPSNLDVAASRSGDQFFLHVVNLDYAGSTEVSFAVDGMAIAGGRVFEIAPESPRAYVDEDRTDVFRPREHRLQAGPVLRWRFPGRSVTAVELDCRDA